MALTAPLIEAVCTNRGEPAIARENSRRTLYSVGPMPGPDHEAIIRFGGEAPKAASRPLP
jgi:hypothetical protein